MAHGYVYILTNKPQGTLYIGVTTDPARRMAEHKESLRKGFSNQYSLTMLVYLETLPSVAEAAERAKELKGWRQTHKLDLISKHNPGWSDLSLEWVRQKTRYA